MVPHLSLLSFLNIQKQKIILDSFNYVQTNKIYSKNK